jgi:hypothetical protein
MSSNDIRTDTDRSYASETGYSTTQENMSDIGSGATEISVDAKSLIDTKTLVDTASSTSSPRSLSSEPKVFESIKFVDDRNKATKGTWSKCADLRNQIGSEACPLTLCFNKGIDAAQVKFPKLIQAKSSL